MTIAELPAEAPHPASPRRRPRLPASRGGVAWMVVLLVVGAFLAVQFGRQVYANWEIGQRASALQAEIDAVAAENERLEAELRYLESDAYISAEARRLGNVGATGEQVLIIPPGAEAPIPDELLAVERPKPMIEQWVDLFFGDAG